ncbi:Response regulator UvrY [Burkholderiales bacterium]|nr:Response regulator UvrY [Burkholderiales bacterium]
MSPHKLRVAIVDDHAIVRQGLRQILQDTEDMVVAGEADCSADAMKLVRSHPVDVMLLDISLPDRHGIETLKLIKKEYAKLPILILSMHTEDQYAVRALRAGAAGYLTKASAPAQLVSAIRVVAGGKSYISPTVAEELAKNVRQDSERPPHELLSDREYQTLCLIASGKTVGDIAEELALSVKTVSVYRARLLEKMGLKNNAELTHYAMKHLLVE